MSRGGGAARDLSLHVARLDCENGGCAAAALQITLVGPVPPL